MENQCILATEILLASEGQSTICRLPGRLISNWWKGYMTMVSSSASLIGKQKPKAFKITEAEFTKEVQWKGKGILDQQTCPEILAIWDIIQSFLELLHLKNENKNVHSSVLQERNEMIFALCSNNAEFTEGIWQHHHNLRLFPVQKSHLCYPESFSKMQTSRCLVASLDLIAKKMKFMRQQSTDLTCYWLVVSEDSQP